MVNYFSRKNDKKPISLGSSIFSDDKKTDNSTEYNNAKFGDKASDPSSVKAKFSSLFTSNSPIGSDFITVTTDKSKYVDLADSTEHITDQTTSCKANNSAQCYTKDASSFISSDYEQVTNRDSCIQEHSLNKYSSLRLIYLNKDFCKSSNIFGKQVVVKYITFSNHEGVFSGTVKKCDCGCTSSACLSRLAVSSSLFDELRDHVIKSFEVIDYSRSQKTVIDKVTVQLSKKLRDTDLAHVRTCLADAIIYPTCKLNVRINKECISIIVKAINDNHSIMTYGRVDLLRPLLIDYCEDHKSSPLAKSLPQLRGFQKINAYLDVVNAVRNSLLLPISYASDLITLEGEYKKMRLCKTILFYGVPGTGKTYLCNAICEELELIVPKSQTNVFVYPPIVKKLAPGYFSSSEDVFKFFEYLKFQFIQTRRLIVLMIDEFDAFCPKRSTASSTNCAITNAFLSCLDGPFACAGVFIVATTNYVNHIDEAIRRPGRIDKEIEIPVPNLISRKQILRSVLLTSGVKQAWVDDDAVIESIAKSCSGYVASDFVLLLRRSIESVSVDFCEELFDSSRVTPQVLKNVSRSIHPSALKELVVEIPQAHWNDIAGYRIAKERLIEAVEWPIKYSHLFDKFSIKASQGILMYGPPGNAKTSLARAVAGESFMNFICVKGPEVFSMWVGESERKIRDIFARARAYAPTIIFFDEIDAIAQDRNKQSASSSNVESRVLSQLLNEMDGISVNENVIVFAATNRPSDLDPALLRPGRIDTLIYIGLPDDETRQEIFKLYGIDADATLVNLSAGFSGAELVMFIREAKMSLLKDEIITQESDKLTTVISQSDRLVDKLLVIIQNAIPRTKPELINYFETFRHANSSLLG